MCSECRQTPCHPRCPGAPDPPEIYECAECGEPIVEGDEYYEVCSEAYCVDCVSSKIAEVEDYND